MEFLPPLVKLFDRSLYVALPFCIGLFCLFVLAKIAPFVGLVDKPTQRKDHTGNIPLVGGPAIFIAVATSAVLLVPQFEVAVFLIASMVILLLGIVDDILDLPAVFRLIVQFAVAIYIALQAHILILNPGNLVGAGPILFSGYGAFIFTAVCSIGVINSVNMIDGVDGLAGSILAISISGMAVLAWNNANLVEAKLLAIIFGAVLSFLILNTRAIFSRAVVFMGDSGSMLMGLVLVWFLISLSQGGNPAFSPVIAGWLFGLPLIDTISVMATRILAGRSPFSADRGHLHHRLLDEGYSVNQTVTIAAILQAALVIVGVVGNVFPKQETTLFWIFVALVVIHFSSTSKLLRSVKRKISHE